MNEKLNNCPFCGGEIKIKAYDVNAYDTEPRYSLVHKNKKRINPKKCPIVTCVGLMLGKSLFETQEEAIAAWNGRTKE